MNNTCSITSTIRTTVLVATLLLVPASIVPAMAVDTVRICTYNVLNYGVGNDDARMPMYTAILQEIQPDILLCQEVADNSLGPQFVSQVLTWSSFAATPFMDGPDSDNQLFYDQLKFTFVNQRAIPTELRNILEVTLERIPEPGQQPDTLVCYLVHLKASNEPEDAEQRGREVKALQANVTSQAYALVAGDCNFYDPSEPGYRELVFATSGREFVDPLGTKWTRNLAAQASIYTQCTRMDNISGCGGGVTGGVDDRFDFILMTPLLVQRVVESSYTAFGNDGLPRLNSSINNPTNTAVSSVVADALLCASDHLPVYTDVLLGDVRAAVHEDHGATIRASFQGSDLAIHQSPPNATITVADVQGHVVYSRKLEQSPALLTMPSLAPGVYIVNSGSSAVVVLYPALH